MAAENDDLGQKSQDWLNSNALPATVEQRQEKVKSRFWPKFKRVMARLPFAEDLLAVYYAAFDPTTPLRARATLLAALAYFIMPVDFLPDVLLGLGFTDDATVLYLAIRTVAAHLKPKHHEEAAKTLASLQEDRKKEA